MNKTEFANYMFEEFPSVFETSFAREMLQNILDYAESLGDKSKQYNYLSAMLPQVTNSELRKVSLNI